MQYRDEGYLPQAVLNYLVRLGWSHGDQEIFSREEMIAYFNLGSINRAPAAFSPEKLLWMNQHYLKTLPVEAIEKQLIWHVQQQHLDITNGPAIADVINAQRERAKTLVEMVAMSRYFYEDITQYDASAVQKQFKADTADTLKVVKAELAAIQDWQSLAIHTAIHNACEQLGVKLGKVGPALRIAVTGGTSSPALDITLALVGKARSLQRIERAIEFIQASFK
jgi:glutamyl-tRNA synthetase